MNSAPKKDGLLGRLRTIHHSDHGVQCAYSDYVGIQGSMSRVGNLYDYVKAESFMKTLKKEEVDGSQYRDLSELRSGT